MFICFNLRFMFIFCFFFFSSRRRHTRLQGDWSSDVCSSDLPLTPSVACAEGCLSYPETSLREPGSERRGVPPSGLQGQGCPSVVPLHQTLGLAASKLHLPALDEPERVRLHRIPHPASRDRQGVL